MSARTIQRAIAFDGGGIRGVFQAQLMAELHMLNLLENSHLLAGTSTGAIIAVCLALGKKPEEIVDLYKTLGKEIFGKKRNLIGRHAFGRTTYSSEALKNILIGKIGETVLFGECSKRVLVAATRLNDRSLQVFDSKKDEHADIPVIDVLLASTAAPTYFSPHYIGSVGKGKTLCVDGGLICNNPAFESIVALQNELHDFSLVSVLSIANGRQPTTPDPKIYHSMTPVSWGLNLIPICMELSSDYVHCKCKKILPQKNYLRIDPLLEREIALDDYQKAESILIPLATITAADWKKPIQDWLRP
jgi:patatin-like phospholipase/acyl hydrolase